jgi:hypothetical protein
MVTVQRLLWNGLWTVLAVLATGSLLVLVTGLGEPVRADPSRGASDSPHTPPSKELLDALLKDYKLFELPFPPEDAPLVRYPVGWRTAREDGTEHELHGLGFLLNRLKPGEDRVFDGISGVREIQDWQTVRPVEPKVIALANVDVVSVELAVQCHARGWTKLALAILELRAIDDDRPPARQLGEAAWSYWQSKILEPDSDRAKIARQLRVILEQRGDDFGKAERNLLRSLELTLVPGKGKPGTVEAAIDSLIDVTATDQTGMLGSSAPDPRYLKVARLGFAAVPALIEHLDDERLTRARKDPLNNFRGYHYRVRDVVCDLLQGLAGEDLGKDWLRRQQGDRLDRADVEKWWAEAKKVGEEEYFVRHVLDLKEDEHGPHRVILDVLANRYPEHLPDAYRRILDQRPELDGRGVAGAVAASSLPKEAKRDLFLHAAGNKRLEHRRDAIEQLREIDPKEAVKALIGALKVMPDRRPDADQTMYWTETRFAEMVIEANDPQAWAALADAAERSTPRLRAELLTTMDYRRDPGLARTERLKFLAKFLEDDEVWKAANKATAAVLKMDCEPMRKWEKEDGEEFRVAVKAALVREGIR